MNSRHGVSGACPDVNCDDELSPLARAQPKDIYSETPDEGLIMASTTVFVLEPGQEPCEFTSQSVQLVITANKQLTNYFRNYSLQRKTTSAIIGGVSYCRHAHYCEMAWCKYTAPAGIERAISDLPLSNTRSLFSHWSYIILDATSIY